MRRKYVYPNLSWDIAGQRKYSYAVSAIFDKIGLNKKNKVNTFLYKLFTVYLNPFQYIYSFKKHVLGLKNKNIFYAN